MEHTDTILRCHGCSIRVFKRHPKLLHLLQMDLYHKTDDAGPSFIRLLMDIEHLNLGMCVYLCVCLCLCVRVLCVCVCTFVRVCSTYIYIIMYFIISLCSSLRCTGVY